MSRARRFACASTSGLLALTWGALAFAAPCGRPDVDVTFPPSGATNVPQNASFSAHYVAPALYLDERATLTDEQGMAVEISTSYDNADSMLRATPVAPLAVGHYELSFPGLRGVSSGVGLGKNVAFFVQDTVDAAAPSFGGLRDATWDLARERDECADSLEDRFVFELSLGAASDDADRELLSVLVFQTRDPKGARDPVKVALRSLPEDGELVVNRPASSAGETCFAAVVQDMVGNLSGGGDKQVCVTTKAPPFFEGCSLARGRAPSSPVGPWGALAAAWLWQQRRRGARAALWRSRPAP
jgi:hypothetical protein